MYIEIPVKKDIEKKHTYRICSGEMYNDKVTKQNHRYPDHISKALSKIPGWSRVYEGTADYCDVVTNSKLKQDIKGLEKLTVKYKLSEKIKDLSFSPISYSFRANDVNNFLSVFEKIRIEYKEPWPWYIKRCHLHSGGGREIEILNILDEEFDSKVKKFINDQDEENDYIYNIFYILQKGIKPKIRHLNKANDGLKHDFRIYGVVLKVKNDIYLYIYNKGIVRKSLTPYKHLTLEYTSHMTNTSLNKHYVDSYKELCSLTELFDDNYQNYNELFSKFKEIYIDIMETVKDELYINYHIYGNNSCFTLLGLDFLEDENDNVYLLEVNKTPAFYKDDDERKDALHKNLEDDFFINFAYLTINQLIEEDIKEDDCYDHSFVCKMKINTDDRSRNKMNNSGNWRNTQDE